MTHPHHIDDLLSHSRWVRRLAKSLLFDQAHVDDVVQQTWMVALQQGPRQPENMRAWLAGVVRNLVRRQVRSEGRRARREQAVSGSGAAPSTDELVSMADSQARVVDAVLALPEPYRATVLMRYFEDLSSAQIARRIDVPSATVRTRLRRALEQLREQLDADMGTSRRAWSLGLLPLAMAGEGAGLLSAGKVIGAGVTGAAIMSMKMKVVTAVVVTVATLGGLWWALGPGVPGTVGLLEDGGGAVVVAPLSNEATEPAEPLESAPAAAEALVALGVEPTTAAASAEAAPDPLHGTVLDGDGEPLAGAEVRFALHPSQLAGLLGLNNEDSPVPMTLRAATESVFTDELGGFVFERDFSRNSNDDLDETVLVVLHRDHVTRVHGNPPLQRGGFDLGVLSMAWAGSVQGRVTDRADRPLAGVTVELLAWSPASKGEAQSGVPIEHELLSRAQRTVVRASTGDDGRFVLTGLPAGQVDLAITRADRDIIALKGTAIASGATTDVGTMMLGNGAQLGGLVQDSAGRPVPAAAVYVRHHQPPPWYAVDPSVRNDRSDALVHTDSEGRFLIGGLLPGPYTLGAKARGTAYAHDARVETGDTSIELTLRAPGEIMLTLRDRLSGEVVPEAQVWANLPERFSELTRRVRDELRVQRGERYDLAPGAFRITGAGAEGTDLMVHAAGYGQALVTAGPVAPGAIVAVEILLDRSLVFSGFVIDDHGDPIAGAHVQMAPRSGPAMKTGTVGHRTGIDGRYAIDAAPGEWIVWVNADRHVGAQTEQRVILEQQTDAPYVVQLTGERLVEGTVTNAEGRHVPGATVLALSVPRREEPAAGRWRGLPISLTSKARDLKGARLATADEMGHYRFLKLTSGRQVLLAVAASVDPSGYGGLDSLPDDLPRGAVDLWLDEQELGQVDLQLMEGAVIYGTVTSSGTPFSGAQVRVVSTPDSAQRWQVVATTTTDQDGGYRLAGMLPGPAMLVVNAPDGLVNVRSITLVDGAADQLAVDLAGAMIRGRVVDADNGEPLAGAAVQINGGRAPGDRYPSLGALSQDTLGRLRNEALGPYWVDRVTNAAGEFAAQHLPLGRADCFASASGYLSTGGVGVTLEESDEPHEVTITMRRAAIIDGTLTAGPDVSVDDFVVHLHDRHTGVRLDSVRPEAGHWSFDPVDVGSYVLRVFTSGADGVEVASRTLQVARGDAKQVEIELD